MVGRRSPHVVILAIAFTWLAAVRAAHPVRGLGNPDIAGILYSADVILDGGLPYRDTLDLKPPGSFFLVAGVFRLVARELWAVHAAYLAWVSLAAPAIWVAGRALYGDSPRGKLASSVGVLLYCVSAGAFDLNYSQWMATPYAWAFALALVGVRTGRRVYPFAAGALVAVAYAFKHQAVVLGVMFLLLLVWGRRRGEPGAHGRALVSFTLGGLGGLLPLGIVYALGGALPDLMQGLFPIGEAARYSSVAVPVDSPFTLLFRVPHQQIRGFPLQLVASLAAVLGVVVLRRRGAEAPAAAHEAAAAPMAPQLAFYALGIVACGLGGLRFYAHYLIQCLPALALLGAHPAAWWWLAPRSLPRSKGASLLGRVHLLALLTILGVMLVQIPLRKSAIVDNYGEPSVEQAGAYIRARTEPGDTIVVWGWSGWGVYYFADRRSPSRVFKMVGQVTTYNDNSRLSRGRSLEFVAGPVADQLVADVLEKRPAFFVRAAPFFPGTRRDPLDDFAALRQVLERDYVSVEVFDKLTLYERRDRRAPELPRGRLRFGAPR
jgi:hypothetical protein